METLISSIRITVATMVVCVGGYSAAIWAIGQAVTPATAEASIISTARRHWSTP